MILKRTFRKSIAILLILITIGNVCAPTVSWALTSGPTVPEATSFEPVDTTDMVNLLTGDLTYNIPLLEVPGPAGGYPLSLSYHAAIQPGEDASWTGLGWTLNPGSIHRNVNGFPDDNNQVNNSSRSYWAGGNRDTYSVGVSVGVNGLVSVDAGLSYSVDTYKGVGGYIGASAGLEGSPFRASASVGISPYGGPNASAGLMAGVPLGAGANSAISLGAQVGVTTNFNSVSFSGGVGVNSGPVSAMGVSISSQGGTQTVTGSLGGISSYVNNSKAGKITTQSYSEGMIIPLPAVMISIGKEHTRYWMDQTENVATNGVLFTPTDSVSSFDNNAYDTYTLQDPLVNPADQPDPNFTAGASFFNYDEYFVNAQGLGGSMRPYAFNELAFRQNRKKSDGTYDITQYPYVKTYYNGSKPAFRFNNDFSNRFLSSNESWATSSSNPVEPQWGSTVYGDVNPDGTPKLDGLMGNQLAGSRKVDWYSIADISQSVTANQPIPGFIMANADGYVPGQKAHGSTIGAFKITNETGVTYYFSLPAYAFDEYEYSENITQSDGKTYNEYQKPSAYAYTWFLTAVTGPDFVDRGPNGTADGKLTSDDWGYWVEFQYGKWTDQYAWRNPEVGYTVDLDNNFRNYGSGKKEVYYLDAVTTATHTALFIKDLRNDAKSTGWAYNLQTKGDYGFQPSQYDETYYDGGEWTRFTNKTYPVSSLQLSRIILVANKDIKAQLATPDFHSYKGLSHLLEFGVDVNIAMDTQPTLGLYFTQRLHYAANVFDTGDFADNYAMDAINSFALRTIDFNYDYSLCPETANSLAASDVYVDNPAANLTTYGKLTLKSLSFGGKGATTGVIPPMQFSYELDNPVQGYSFLSIADAAGVCHLSQTNSGLNTGDILKLSGSSTYYALVTSISNGDHALKIVGKNNPTISESVSWTTTKNPPYNKDLVDEWGLFKADYYPSPTGAILPRACTNLSAPSTDAWSLRKISTSLGADISIEYEPDDYSTAVLQNSYHKLSIIGINYLGIDPASPDPVNKPIFQYSLSINNEGTDLRSLYNVGDEMKCVFGGTYSSPSYPNPLPTVITGAIINTVSGNSLTVSVEADPTFQFQTGVVYYKIENKTGGGLRVKSIGVSDDVTATTRKTSYDYSYVGNSSGTTSYEPDVFDKMALFGSDDVNKLVKTSINNDLTNILGSAREVPSPGSLYEFVTVRESVINGVTEFQAPTSSRYHFQVLKPAMIGFSQAEQTTSTLGSTYSNVPYGSVKQNFIALKDFTSWIGKLKEITLFDANNNAVSKTTNNYLHDQLGVLDNLTNDDIARAYETALQKFNQQGEIQEAVWDARFVKNSQSGSNNDLLAVISKRQTYPAIPTGQTNVNYKTGVTTATTNLAFDFFSGQVTSTLSVDGYGNNYLSVSVPAYRNYTAMGLAMNGGANMLTQEAASYTYKVSSSGAKLGVVSAAAQTWSNQISVIGQSPQTGVWRKQSAFSFIGDASIGVQNDGLYPSSSFTEFSNWTDPSNATSVWQKNVEITLYDTYSHAIEAVDVNGNPAATRMTTDQSRTMATANNARVAETACTSAEDPLKNTSDNLSYDWGGGVISDLNAIRSGLYAHSGIYSLYALSGAKAFVFSAPPGSKTYHVSMWSTASDAVIKFQVDNGPVQASNQKSMGVAGGWYLIEADIQVVASSTAVIWCEAVSQNTFFDDFRVHPLNASMTSYVYNTWGEVTHILNANNLFTRYEYDAMGRLTKTYRETLSTPVTQTSEVIYHYSNH